jgi:hypothetical protein
MTGREAIKALDPTDELNWVQEKAMAGYRSQRFLDNWISEYPTLPDYYYVRGVHFIRWIAWHWGIDPFAPDVRDQVVAEHFRRRPCQECGCSHRESVNQFRCDRCFMRSVVKGLRDDAKRKAWRLRMKRDRAAARELMGNLSPARRRFVERSGVSMLSPADVYAEAHGEW